MAHSILFDAKLYGVKCIALQAVVLYYELAPWKGDNT